MSSLQFPGKTLLTLTGVSTCDYIYHPTYTGTSAAIKMVEFIEKPEEVVVETQASPKKESDYGDETEFVEAVDEILETPGLKALLALKKQIKYDAADLAPEDSGLPPHIKKNSSLKSKEVGDESYKDNGDGSSDAEDDEPTAEEVGRDAATLREQAIKEHKTNVIDFAYRNDNGGEPYTSVDENGRKKQMRKVSRKRKRAENDPTYKDDGVDTEDSTDEDGGKRTKAAQNKRKRPKMKSTTQSDDEFEVSPETLSLADQERKKLEAKVAGPDPSSIPAQKLQGLLNIDGSKDTPEESQKETRKRKREINATAPGDSQKKKKKTTSETQVPPESSINPAPSSLVTPKPPHRGPHKVTQWRQQAQADADEIFALGLEEIEKKVTERQEHHLDVYTFGSNAQGQLGLGLGEAEHCKTAPTLVKELDSGRVGVVLVAAGARHGAALTRDNRILTWGEDKYGALGRDTEFSPEQAPLQSEVSGKVLYSTNNPNPYRLSPRAATPGYIETESFPAQTEFLDLVAGRSFTFALTTEGKVFGWGTFLVSQTVTSVPDPFTKTQANIMQRTNPDPNVEEHIVGFSPRIRVQTRPTQITSLPPCKSIVAGASHMLAMDFNGNVWSWGINTQSQLGHPQHPVQPLVHLNPRRLTSIPTKVQEICTGFNTSFFISEPIGPTPLYSTGQNSTYQAGHRHPSGAYGFVAAPCHSEALSMYKFKKVNGGIEHMHGINGEGRISTWGNPRDGRSGIKPANLKHLTPRQNISGPTKLFSNTEDIETRIQTMSSGPAHTILIEEKEGRAFAFGNGVDGQLGLAGRKEVVVEPTEIERVEETVLTGSHEEEVFKRQTMRWESVSCGWEFGILTTNAQIWWE